MSEYSNNMTLRATLIIILLILALGVSWVYFLTRKPEIIEKEKIEYKTDTVTIIRPVPKYITLKEYCFIEVPRDSIVYVHDTDSVLIPVPIEEKTFTDDSTYLAVISGFNTNLEHMEVYQRTTTITKTVIKKPILSIGPSVSGGYNPITKQFDFSIGASIIIPVYSIYR